MNPSGTRIGHRVLAAATVVGLLVVVAFVYAPVRDHGFAGLDDRAFLVENPNLAAGLSLEGLRWAATTTVDGSWIPVTWSSFLVDAQVHGLSPAGTHLGNLVLHGLASVLLFLALLRLTDALAPSAFCAAVFALHPLHVESVAWAMERKDVLSGVFFSGTLIAYASYARRGGGLRWAATTALFTLGLMAKPMLVTVPFLLLLLDAWPLRRLGSRAERRRAVLEKLPLIAIAAALSILTFVAQRGAGAMESSVVFPVGVRISNAIVSSAVYLRKAFWPSDLAFFYPHPGSLPLWQVAASAAILLAVSLLGLAQARRRPHVLVGWLWYLGMLVPVIGLVQVGVQGMADRYTYLPLIGVTVALAWTGAELADRGRGWKRAVVAVALASLVASTALARRQVAYWQDSVATYERSLVVNERNPVAHNGLGGALYDLGKVEEALAHLKRAIELAPDFVDAHVNLGIVLVETGNPQQAVPHLERGLDLPEGRMLRVHSYLGTALRRTGHPYQAVGHLQSAVDLGGATPEVYVELALALLDVGRTEDAARTLRRGEVSSSASADVQMAWAQIAQRQGNTREVVRRYRLALELQPNAVQIANNLAWILATDSDPAVRDADEAVRLAERAVRATGATEPAVLDTLAVAYEAAGRRDEALAASRRALRIARRRGQAPLAREIEKRIAEWEAR
jgi:tetratricopeptide (TPR) repeat protein